ncbi:MAG: aminotransferase class V-fold PLP-dependent enzyme [Planctomycetia bacterium]|nr:aminotransferase class V-fold PLP-dependent enzyme [Planctomycetia bacterium]
MPLDLAPDDHDAWRAVRAYWSLRPDTTYLNHGSFGPPPLAVRQARRQWQDQLDEQPMDFFIRRFEPAWHEARQALARFVGTRPENLVFVDNATVGMNIVADSFPLSAGDKVLMNDHEYGAVKRIWQRACDGAGASLVTVELPLPFRTAEETVDALLAAATERTRLIVVSHITSPTAVTLPVAEICRRARQRGIAVAIDGPHAVAQLPVNTDAIDCDFYTASCHKWLSAPFGTGYLYVAPRRQASIRPPVLSWGRVPPTPLTTWADEFVWSGTCDPSAWLAIPAAIEFLETTIGLTAFRTRSHWLAQYARRKLMTLGGQTPLVPDDAAWYTSMAHVPLPPANGAALSAQAREFPGDGTNDATQARALQAALWRELQIEVPIIEFRGERYVRVSCHLYNDTGQIDTLYAGLADLLRQGW